MLIGYARVRAVNQWLDTEDQIETLVRDYLLHIYGQLVGDARKTYDSWLYSIRYD